MRSRDASSATQWVVDRRHEQVSAHEGSTLIAQARSFSRRLPQGPLTLLTTSAEGAALAGALCAMRESPTSWRVVHFGARCSVDGPVAVVEAVTLGEGVRSALQRQFPDALILDGAGKEIRTGSLAA
jgi:hypothetical protein